MSEVSVETQRGGRVDQRRAPRGAPPPIPMNDTGDEDIERDAILDDRPVIRLGEVELHEAIRLGVAALRGDPDLYQRDATLVHVVRAPTLGDEEEGAPQIHAIAVDTLRARLTRYARWERFSPRTGESIAVVPPDNITKGIHAAKEWGGIRPLVGVIDTPTLRPDGTVISSQGYDAATGYIYAPSCAYPTVLAKPTREDAQRALAVLEDVFIDFPYGTPAGRSVAVAAALTLIARPAIRGATPVAIFDANTPGSGKTLQADSACVLATGRDSGRKNFPTDKRAADEEVNKILCGYALLGTRCINFDNLSPEVQFGGSALEMVVTAENSVDFRLLSTNRILQLPWRTVVFGSGNNVSLTRDMLRRCMVARIESPYERPENRPLSDFKHPERAFGLKRWIREHRPELVAAALTLLRAHAVAGRPSPGRTWASFESWTAVVADAIVWAGGADPLECRPSESADANPERVALAALMAGIQRLDEEGKGLRLRVLLSSLYPPERVRGEAMPPDGHEDTREAIEALVETKPRTPPDATKLGKVFAKYRRTNIGGVMLDSREDRRGNNTWRVAQVPRA
ncbi:hypothetical protein WMF20_35465 [Sorangium sp. So ce834]|uniref:hypothetical protein n=1 Tax=Sorangium sp. So ce834 TaxID=3133321 RepID=UPI003F647431